jgi:hypothetical protein
MAEDAAERGEAPQNKLRFPCSISSRCSGHGSLVVRRTLSVTLQSSHLANRASEAQERSFSSKDFGEGGARVENAGAGEADTELSWPLTVPLPLELFLLPGPTSSGPPSFHQLSSPPPLFFTFTSSPFSS